MELWKLIEICVICCATSWERGPVDPSVQLLIIFSLAEEKYVSHYEHWRLIAGFLLQRSVSDWPAVDIIAKSCCLRNSFSYLGLSVWLTIPETVLSSASGSSGQSFLFLTAYANGILWTILVKGITVIREWKVGCLFRRLRRRDAASRDFREMMNATLSSSLKDYI